MSAGALLATLPALPLHEAGKYVAGAYVVLFALVLVYVAIMGVRLTRIQREVGELLAGAREGELAQHGQSTEQRGRREPDDA